MRTKPFAALAAAAATALTLGLAACSGSTPGPPVVFTPPATATGGAPSAPPASPVPLLKQTGATPEPGTVAGQVDVYGNRYAAGTLGNEDVRVYTSADQAAYAENLHRNRPDDFHGVISVPASNALVLLTAYIDPAKGDGPQWAPGGTPAQVAARVGGQVVQP